MKVIPELRRAHKYVISTLLGFICKETLYILQNL
jgi:hypothetical protein